MRYAIALIALLSCAANAQTIKTCTSLSAPGCNCSVSATNIGYGSVPVNQLSSFLGAVGLVTLSCSASGQTSVSIAGGVQLNIPYQIALGPTTSRQLTNGSYSIPYEIYQNASHTTAWGTQADGKALSGTMSILITTLSTGNVTLNFPLTTATNIPYAQISVPPSRLITGLYSDTVTMTVSY